MVLAEDSLLHRNRASLSPLSREVVSSDPPTKHPSLSTERSHPAKNHVMRWLMKMAVICALCGFAFRWIRGTPPFSPIHGIFDITSQTSTGTHVEHEQELSQLSQRHGLSCIERGPSRSEGWITACGSDFLRPENLKKHYTADWLVDGKMIAMYRVEMQHGSKWTKWYIPGVNDNEPVHRASYFNSSTWDEESYQAGRRRWTDMMLIRNQVCFYNQRDPTFDSTCRRRRPQGEEWVTARGHDFLKVSNLQKHATADLRLDGKRICRYRIRWFANNQWSEWKYPGGNDIRDYGKSDSVWNSESYAAGRRDWTLFADHEHEVCYCIDLEIDDLSPQIT